MVGGYQSDICNAENVAGPKQSFMSHTRSCTLLAAEHAARYRYIDHLCNLLMCLTSTDMMTYVCLKRVCHCGCLFIVLMTSAGLSCLFQHTAMPHVPAQVTAHFILTLSTIAGA